MTKYRTIFAMCLINVIPGSLDKYCDALAKMDQTIYIMCLPSFMVQYLHHAKYQEELKKYMVIETNIQKCCKWGGIIYAMD